MNQAKPRTVHLGFEIGSGKPVEIPIAHTFVTGQTQLSGKTTALRAIVERCGRRALAFVTKRGERFEGARIRPYLPREGEKQLPWRLVEAIMAASLGQRNMKWERGAIVIATKGATTLEQVRKNVAALQERTKNPKNQELYMLLGEYLDLVLPEMKALRAADQLQLQPGLNVMDLGGIGTQTQAMVIRAALEHINQHETGVLTVFPEAWEFAPRGRSAPAKDEAIAMARKGAVLQNFLLCDSQDLAGVDTVVRQAASVWLLGVQRELNELKRTLQMIPAGVKRPKPEDVAQLELGQFYACWGRHALKVYVQPSWMNHAQAEQVATGALSIDIASSLSPGSPAWGPRRTKKEDQVNEAEAQTLREENKRLARENEDLRRRLDRLEGDPSDRGAARQDDGCPADHEHASRRPAVRGAASDATGGSAGEEAVTVRQLAGATPLTNDALYAELLARLVKDAAGDPVLLRVIASKPELEVRLKRVTIEADGDSLRGRIAQLIADGFFDEGKGPSAVIAELQKRGAGADVKFNTSKELQSLTNLGFFLRIGKTSDTKYEAVPGMKVRIVEA